MAQGRRLALIRETGRFSMTEDTKKYIKNAEDLPETAETEVLPDMDDEAAAAGGLAVPVPAAANDDAPEAEVKAADSIENYGYEDVPGSDIAGFEELAEFGEISEPENAQEQRLFRLMDEIQKVDRNAMIEALERQEKLAKPPGSLGGLEEIAVRMAGITGSVRNSIDRSCVVVMCADNGVAEEGVSSAPQSVTRAQTINLAKRITGAGVLAESFGSDMLVVDMGVKDPIPEELYTDEPLKDTRKIVNRRLRAGTSNISEGPAMTLDEVIVSIMTGIEMADAVSEAGFDIAGVGEMGIGNTTTSAAVLSAITGLDSSETCGRGGGIIDESFARKKEIVDAVSEKYRTPDREKELYSLEDIRHTVLEILADMGGFDICAMAGVFIGAARNRMPVVIDGYISAVAALVAYMLAPDSVDYMFASHQSWEKGYSHAVKALGLSPFLALNMRLGEGSGCPAAFDIIRGACDVMNRMATFEEADINDSYLSEIREADCF